MEYGPDNGKYYSKSKFYYNLFCYWNNLEWLFENSFSNCNCRFIYYSDCHCITSINLYRWIKYTYSEWCNIVSMEYRADNRKYHGESDFNNNLFGYWNKF